MNLDGLSADVAMKEEEKAIVLPKADPNDPNAIANLAFDVIAQRAASTPGDPEKGKALFKQQSCINCHTFANGQQPKGPHLVDIGKRYKRAELIESIVPPAEQEDCSGLRHLGLRHGRRQGLHRLRRPRKRRNRHPARRHRNLPRLDPGRHRRSRETGNLDDAEWSRWKSVPEQLADLIAYLESLR